MSSSASDTSKATDPEAVIGGEASFAAYAENPNVAELPGLDCAMWPGDVELDEDVSAFNDRYFEPSPIIGDQSFVLYMFGLAHNFGVLSALVFEPLSGMWGWGNLVIYLVGLAMALPFFLLTKKALENDRIRFNRQAQVVHVKWVKNSVLHLPWHEMRPFTESKGGNFLRFGFPVPSRLRAIVSERTINIIYAKKPFTVMGMIAGTDVVSVSDNLRRLEFMRRYMERGVEAIRPAEGVTTRKIVNQRIPAHFKDIEGAGQFFLWLFLYWPSLGPLIDRWMRYKANQFRWPEEVEQMCAPDADLSAFDTQPVRPSSSVYYRINGYGFDLCDKHGKLILPPGSFG